jgi:flagellar export protein FliJ
VVPRTRVDKVVWLRERAEDGALASLARARAELDRAREQVARAAEAAQVDTRVAGRVELWLLDDDGHRRALQALSSAQGAAHQALSLETAARDGYSAARQGTEAVRRVQGRRRAEIVAEVSRRERLGLDEIATLRFNAAR